VIDGLDSSEIGLLLQFVTGSSKIPLDGFKALQGMNGYQPFNIKRLHTDDLQTLPCGHTCFN
jgi:E3 ubiquitin-protein ligase HUWE1